MQPGTQASNLYNTSTAQGNTLFGQAQTDTNSLTPFYQQELNNPQGLGATTMSQLLTQSGQSIAGGEGAARQTALDLGARTGNTAATPSIIGNAAKQGMVAQSDAANKLQIANTMMKQQQQQEGASGLNSLYDNQLKGTFSAEDLSNQAIQTRIKANAQRQSMFQTLFKDVAGAGLIAAGAFTANPLLVGAGAKTLSSGGGDGGGS